MHGQIYNVDIKDEREIEGLVNHLKRFLKIFGEIKVIAWTAKTDKKEIRPPPITPSPLHQK